MKDKNKVIKKIVNSLNANDYESARKIIERDLKRFGEDEEYYFYLALITENLEKDVSHRLILSMSLILQNVSILQKIFWKQTVFISL